VKGLNKYEVIYIIDARLEDEPRKELIDRFAGIITSSGGTIDKVEEWGKRRLSYPINFQNEGYYVLLHMTAAPEFPRELERNFEISEQIIRYLIVRIEE
jgi:small subunit ribosomal protein S6